MAGRPSTNSAGERSSAGTSGIDAAAGEAGMVEGTAGGAQGGAPNMSIGGGGSGGISGRGGAGGGAGMAGGTAGAAGAATGGIGQAGTSSSAGRGGVGGSTGGSGGSSGVGGSSGGSSGGAKAAVCGDQVVTAPEFCDKGKNLDLSYGCYACTTLPAESAPPGAQQCDACLSQVPNQGCLGCEDHRACYACLRRQASSFGSADGLCNADDDDDATNSPATHKKFSDVCFDPSDPDGKQLAGGSAAATATRGDVCQALVACILRTGCSKPPKVWLNDCYCGTGVKCGAEGEPAAGPCVKEFRQASALPPGLTQTQEAIAIGVGWNDADPPTTSELNPRFPLGVVGRLTECAAKGCASACYPSTGTAGSGGSGSGSAGSGGGVP
jgi:hypothetical protein